MKINPKSISLLLLACTLLSFAVSSCHTVRGIGRDVESVGDHIERSGR